MLHSFRPENGDHSATSNRFSLAGVVIQRQEERDEVHLLLKIESIRGVDEEFMARALDTVGHQRRIGGVVLQ